MLKRFAIAAAVGLKIHLRMSSSGLGSKIWVLGFRALGF